MSKRAPEQKRGGHAAKKWLRIAFCHPDLGLGGAERLVVDAAVELAAAGHNVDMYTAFHDRMRCFEETLDGSFPVIVAGQWFPRSFFGRMHALCAYIRCMLVALHIAWVAFRRGKPYDAIVVDQVSAVVPLLHFLTRSRVLFYCHFPDLLLAQRQSSLHAAYRAPIDWLEQETTGQADKILVNSAFTQGVFAETFRRLHLWRRIVPDVLHPAVQIPADADLQHAQATWRNMVAADLRTFLEAGPVFVSINRFERKKEVELAIRALHALPHKHSAGHDADVKCCRLVIAGGYDARLAENREYMQELKDLIAELDLQDKVFMLPSFSDAQRAALLASCRALLYTPQAEHFGIVPLEAMAAGRPVIACNSGGPLETVVHGITGYLCRATPESFASAMAGLIDEQVSQRMGKAARAHVQKTFSRSAFGVNLQVVLRRMIEAPAIRKPNPWPRFLMAMSMPIMFGTCYYLAVNNPYQ
ncbi:hypothetical protein WJX72_002056 [[Myrmecia] bisecta]|uniref:Alpha-1,3/1,6-mannosyltransferase ALG2 n=1 Tax=[Myrmecia] bisecta TaxID=41462 RepID=A0AAW1PMV5_9CHLO